MRVRRALLVLITLPLAAACSSSGPGPRTSAPPSTRPAATPQSSTPRSSTPQPRTAGSSTPQPPGTTGNPGTPTRPPTATATPTAAPAAQRVLARLSLAERVGQLFMVDCPSTTVADATVTAISRYHVGSVILDGTSHAGVQRTAALTAQLQRYAGTQPALFVATDQEGGLVQRLQGPGFAPIPSALAQSRLSPAALRADATTWGRQLRAAGVTVDLAPVLDTVPDGFGSNPPIGDLSREYGHTPEVVRAHGLAFARGLAAAGVAASVKHFPGLGRVHGNTDVSSGVRDSLTTRHDGYLAPFAAAVHAGAPFVMISTAIYSRIDPDRPATFSRTIVTGMLRGELGFDGVIISDDLGAAKQVSDYSAAQRAVQFIAAGGDIVLTVDANAIPQMTAAVLARAKSDPSFRKQVDAAALTVLRAKQAQGLLGG